MFTGGFVFTVPCIIPITTLIPRKLSFTLWTLDLAMRNQVVATDRVERVLSILHERVTAFPQ